MLFNLRKTGLMLILSSPSGGGKSSLAKALLKIDESIKLSISATTRGIRPGEIDGINYYFKTLKEFENLIKENKFIEYANIYGNYYGTLKEEVTNILAKGFDVLFDIDWHGTQSIKSKRPNDVVTIFISPPSLDILKKRIIQRARDTEEVIERRLQLVSKEMKWSYEYDYVVINDNFDETLTKIQNILNAERAKTRRLDNLDNFLKTFY